MLKKILAGLVCLSMVFAFAACESSDDSKEEANAATVTDADADADVEDSDADVDEESDADTDESDDAAETVDLEASDFVGTSWSSTIIMTDADHASTIEEYSEATGTDLSTLQTTITFIDETNCVVTSNTASEEGTWTYADGTVTVTDPKDNSEQALTFNTDYNALVLPLGEMSLVLTQAVQAAE